MRIACYFLFSLLLLAFSINTNGQQLKENEIVVIQGKKFILHQVRTGETVFAISRHYQTDTSELLLLNPQIADGIQIGEILKIPYREDINWKELPANPKGDPAWFDHYTITSRTETPYFIAREFGITVEEIYAYNPEVTRFRIGTKLRIPVWDIPETETDTETPVKTEIDEAPERELIVHEVMPGETLYSLSRKYQVSESEILFLNPGAKELKAGTTIYLPRAIDYPEKTEAVKDKFDMPRAPSSSEAVFVKDAYFEHTIISGETLWSITRKYNVTEEELTDLNPVLISGFPAGVAIRIPVKETDLITATPVNEEAFFRHEVLAGETLFGLASQYNLSIPEIRKFNPQLESRNLVRGETLLIPRMEEDKITPPTETEVKDSLMVETPLLDSDFYNLELPTIIPEYCRSGIKNGKQEMIYNVALFLPLFIQANETLNQRHERIIIPLDSLMLPKDYLSLEEDSLIEMDEPKELFYSFYRDSENFLQFYEGVLLAVDSLRKAGMQIRMHVFDTQQNPDSIRKYIYSVDFLNTDLIIGPVYVQVQDEVAAIAAKNRIPMVSPLSSQSRELNSNPWYFQVNPTRNLLSVKTAEMITEEYYNSNFVLVRTAHSDRFTEEEVVDMVREKMLHSGYWNQTGGLQYNLYDFTSEGPFGFKRVLSPEKENVIFVASMNEGELSVILSNINNLAGRYSFTLIGFNRYEQFHSISDEFFHNLNLNYVAPYWVDYNHPETIRFLEKFRRYFHTEPDNFGIQGYDVAFYFLSALKKYGKDFAECLPYHQVHLIQGNYRFEKVSQYGGYMNQGVSVISYEPNFDIIRKRIVGPYRFAQR